MGERKVRTLLASGARVCLVSPAVTPGLRALASEGRIYLRKRPFRTADLQGMKLVVAATGRPSVDAAVARAARRRRILVNVVDRPALSDVLFPSVLRRGNFQIAVSTGGRSPALAREVRRRLEPLFPPSLAVLVERAGAARARALAEAHSPGARRAAAEAIARRTLRRLRREVRKAVV